MQKFLPKLTSKEILILALGTVLYFTLTSANLTRLPIFVDEALYLRWSQIAWHDASWRFISLTDGKQPLYIWLVIPFMKIFSDPLVAGRMASVFSGYILALGMWYLGWLIKDKKTGHFAALLALVSPYLFFYNRFGVMEALLTASGVWTVNLSILLARTVRLDIALLLGMALGGSLLVKSSAFFFLLLSPLALLARSENKILFPKPFAKFFILLAISWILATVIYNVQRLSPWMHMIGDKNSFFTVPYAEIFNEPARILNNLQDIVRWNLSYTTLGVILLGLWGIARMTKSASRMSLYLLSCLTLPLLGTALIARLFAPRYIVFSVPYLLVFVAYILSSLRPQLARILTLISTAYPAYLISLLILDPLKFPYVSVDEGYVNGWSAGNGTRQISEYLVEEASRTSEKIFVFTEGTFGILPHGLELYTDGRAGNLEIIGIYPVNNLPPEQALEKSSTSRTYLILNNTELMTPPPGLDLIKSYPKLKDTSMRLYLVTPPVTP